MYHDEKQPDLIGLTEVWTKGELRLEGYHPVFRHDRKEKKGCGVMIFIQNSFELARPLVFLFQKSLDEGHVPLD